MTGNVQLLQERLNYSFRDESVLMLALSHRSCGNSNNERLEFLGDAILGLSVTDILYRNFPKAREGELSRMRSQIVRAESLASVAKQLELGSELLLGPGEMKSGGHRRDSILGDTVEALIGAVYVDTGLAAAQGCIAIWFKDLLAAASEADSIRDPKTSLQEWLQKRGKPVPDYTLINTGGEAHSRLFTVSCKIAAVEKEISAVASSVRKAEQMVAAQLLIELEKSS